MAGEQFLLFLTEHARKQYGSECSINLLILILRVPCRLAFSGCDNHPRAIQSELRLKFQGSCSAYFF